MLESNTPQKALMLSLFFALLLISCSKRQEPMIVDEQVFEDTVDIDMQLDYLGTYLGIIPCTDCEGIETVIELGPANSYVKKIKYLGKDDTLVIESTGIFIWDASGMVITLGDEKEPNQYLVRNGFLQQLDSSGNLISGNLEEKYRLKKQ